MQRRKRHYPYGSPGYYAERAKQHERRDAAFIKADRIMREYESAYAAANGSTIVLEYRHGWCVSDKWVSPYRLAEVENLTQTLWARAQLRQELENESP